MAHRNQQDAIEALDLVARGKVKTHAVLRKMEDINEYVLPSSLTFRSSLLHILSLHSLLTVPGIVAALCLLSLFHVRRVPDIAHLLILLLFSIVILGSSTRWRRAS